MGTAQPTYLELPGRCNNPRPGAIINRAERRFIRCPCGRWRCPGCARYKSRVVARRFQMMVRGYTARMVTVTLAQELDERTAKRQLRTLRRWMTRNGLIERSGWVAEFGPRGHRLHFHMLVATNKGFWPYAALQSASRRCGLGNVDVSTEVKHDQSSRYLAKYLVKGAPQKSIGPRRRFHCPEPPPPPSGAWEFSREVPTPETCTVRMVLGSSGVYLTPLESG